MTSRCSKLAEVGRRQFLRGSVVGAAALPTLGFAATQAKAATNGARLEYVATKLGNIKDLKANEPMDVTYPDADAPGVLIKMGKAVEGGAGPDGDIVGFSTICPHKGYGLLYKADTKTMHCPGHYSVFDCESGGQQTFGHATQNLPQYALRVDDKGDIYAEGVDELLYGRLSNVL